MQGTTRYKSPNCDIFRAGNPFYSLLKLPRLQGERSSWLLSNGRRQGSASYRALWKEGESAAPGVFHAFLGAICEQPLSRVFLFIWNMLRFIFQSHSYNAESLMKQAKRAHVFVLVQDEREKYRTASDISNSLLVSISPESHVAYA